MSESDERQVRLEARAEGRAIIYLSAAIATGYASVYILFRWLIGSGNSFTENVFVVLYFLVAFAACIHCAKKFSHHARRPKRLEESSPASSDAPVS